MLKKETNLKLYYTIGEVAEMFQVNESLLRFWEKRFPQLTPKRAGRSVRQYTEQDIETIKVIYHLVKECGLTIQGARQRLNANRENVAKNMEIVDRLKKLRGELVAMKDALDSFTYEQIDNLKIHETPLPQPTNEPKDSRATVQGTLW